MKTMPIMLRRVPNIFYGLAIFFAVWSIVNGWAEISAMGAYADPSLEGVMALGKSKILYQAFLEAAYLVASGALIHAIIFIYDRLGGAPE